MNHIFVLDPYRMVIVNALAFFLTYAAYLVVSKKRPASKFPWLLFLLIFSFLPLISIFRQGTYESGDLSINVYKTIAFFRNLQEGILVPRWAADANATYGYPNFIFAYPLPYYLASFFHLLGFSFLNSLKCVLVTTFLVSGLTMYLWLRSFSPASAAFVGALCYLYAPYHLVNLHFRVDVGELTALAILPLAFWGITQMVRKPNPLKVIGTAIILGCLILSHQAVSLIGFPVLFLYGVVISRPARLRDYVNLLLPFVLALLLTAYYWLPVLMESPFTHQSINNREVTFLNPWELFYSKWRLGLLFQGPQGELSFLLGYVQWLIVIGGLIIWRKKDLPSPVRRLLGFFLLVLGIILVAALPVSRFIWSFLPLLSKIQFTYRLLNLAILLVAAITAIVCTRLRPAWLTHILAGFIIITTLLNWGNRRTIPEYLDSYFIAGVPLGTYYGEGLGPAAPRWTNPSQPWQTEVPLAPLEVLDGPVKLLDFRRTSIRHQYNLKAEKPTRIKENTLYFPGWTVTIDGQPYPLNPATSLIDGIITFSLPTGNHTVDVAFHDTPTRMVAKIITLLSILGVGLYLCLIGYRKAASPQKTKLKTYQY
jgi:hypothetical protein